MKLIVFSASGTFEQFLKNHLESDFEFQGKLKRPLEDPDQLYLLHISSMELDCYEWLLKHVSGAPIKSEYAPTYLVSEKCSSVCGWAPGRIATVIWPPCTIARCCNYWQMGQSWFPPKMLDETFRLAQQTVEPTQNQQLLEGLTAREKDIALAVAEGKSNRKIADLYEITEPTVKTHLTNIFRKLELKDRVGLVLYLKQA